MKEAVPVYILSGFLGSGKTTLLGQLLEHFKQEGKKPAVVMNELGEVNLDGQIVGSTVPMAELLGGCICCSIRGDLSTELATLIKQEQPDVVIIEATGAANPLEVVDGVTEVSLYLKVELKGLITVVDAAHLLELHRAQKGATYRLMQEQIRCASVLLMNKTDRINPEEAEEVRSILEKWNGAAPVRFTEYCAADPAEVLSLSEGGGTEWEQKAEPHDPAADGEGGTDANPLHDHVMAYTHYFSGPVNSESFEALIKDLPRDVYRAKGIVSFNDAAGRFLFQYAYRETDFMKITPQGDVPDVAVFIGEQFSREKLRTQLLRLEKGASALPGKVRRGL